MGRFEFGGLIYSFSADRREKNLHVRNLANWDFEYISVEHDEVGELADFERSHIILRVQLVGGIGGYRADRGRQRKSYVGAEPACVARAGRWVVLARNAHLDAKPLVERIDGPIAAIGDARAGRCQITRGLEIFETL